MRRKLHVLLALALVVQGCRIVDGDGDRDDGAARAPGSTEDAMAAAPLWRIRPPATEDDLLAAWRDTTWRVAVRDGPTGAEGATDTTLSEVPPSGGTTARRDSAGDARTEERFADIGAGIATESPAASRPPSLSLPLTGGAEGPSALRAQILLDLALFSPGVADGRWHANAERALYWFQRREGLAATGVLDRPSLDRLWQAAGSPDTLLGMRVLTSEDVEGPFATIPQDVYRKAELDCLCYASLGEKLAELAHTTPEVLARLNSGRDLNRFAAGDSIRVPLLGRFAGPSRRVASGRAADSAHAAGAARGARGGAGASAVDPDRVRADSSVTGAAIDTSARHPDRRVARLVISDRGRYLHGVDAAGRVLFHVPATLGSEYFPSPDGSFEVRSISRDPWFHYQPALLEGVDPSAPEARLAPGPNSPVGVVWIALSKEHYGIHGTDAPETIGFVTSSGCVRLTNWDARLVAAYVTVGTPVEFRDVRGASAEGRTAGPSAGADTSGGRR